MDRGKRSFIALVAVFVMPVLLGTLVYFNKDRLGLGQHTVNYGQLVTPVMPVRIQGLAIAGQPASREQTVTRKWTLLFIAPQQCDHTCMERMLLMKRLRLLMNEDMRRVRTLLVTTNPALEDSLKQDYPDFVFAHVKSDTAPFLLQFRHQEFRPVYLIDPLGNLMMVYLQQKPDHKAMIKDLKRLLKYSRIG